MTLLTVLAVAAAAPCDDANPLECAPQNALDNVPEACEYRVVYDLFPAIENDYKGTDPGYSVDNSDYGVSYDRVAYYVEVDGDWAWVSMDDFTTHPSELGVPDSVLNPVVFAQPVTDMTVESNVPGVVTGSNITTGNIEMWSNCYHPANAAGIPGASGGTYDFGDQLHPAVNCYGSFQVHNYGESQTVFAWSEFQHPGHNAFGDDFTIGNAAATGPDGTFQSGFNGTTDRRVVMMARFADAGCAAESATVGDAMPDIVAFANGAYVGTDPVDEGSTKARLRPSRMQDDLERLATALTEGGCTLSSDVQGVAAGAYDGGTINGEDEAGPVAGTFDRGTHTLGMLGTDVGIVGDAAATYSSFTRNGRHVSKNSDGDWMVGYWTRVRGTRGIWTGLHGTCDGGADIPAALDRWFDGDLTTW